MKYVIKELVAGNSYIIPVTDGTYFNYTTILTEATRFDTLGAAIAAIAKRVMNIRSGGLCGAKFTVVGVKEINQPRYEEVLL